MRAQRGDLVEVHFSMRVSFGESFDSSHGREPLRLVAGAEAPLPAVGDAVVGMAVGEMKRVVVQADDAFGVPDPSLVRCVPLSLLPAKVKVGDRLLASGAQERTVTVLKVEGGEAILDGNHPLAGQALVLEVQLVSIDKEQPS